MSGYFDVEFEGDIENKKIDLKKDSVVIQLGGLNITDFYEYLHDDECVDVS